jgi:hypothetical protein
MPTENSPEIGIGARVDAHGVGDEDAHLHAGDDVVERRRRPGDEQIARVRAGQARVAAAHAVAGARAAGLARRVRVVQEALEHAPRDQRRAPAGHALAVERRAVEPVLDRSVVDQLKEFAGDALALAPGEQRAPLLHGVGRERGAEHAEEGRRDEGIEDDRRLHRRALLRAEQACGAPGGLGADERRVEVLRARPTEYE